MPSNGAQSVTHDEWKAKFNEIRLHLQNDRGVPAREATLRARVITGRRHGKQPPGLPLKARVALWWLGRKLKGVKPMEVSMLWKKVIVALLFGIGAVSATLNLALADGVMSGQDWMAVVTAFVGAAWGKFSSNTTVIAASRKGETLAGPES